MNTCSKAQNLPIWEDPLTRSARRGAASQHYRNRVEIAVSMCEQMSYSIWFWCWRSFSLGTYQPAGSMNYQTVSYACAQSCPQPLRQWQPWANSWFALILACVQTPLPSEKIGEGAPSPIFTEGRGLYTGYPHLASWNIVMKKKYTLF